PRVLDAFDQQGDFGVRADLDQAEFANLRPGTATAVAAVGVAESRRVGGGIRDALDRAIEGHQPPGVVESAGRLPRGQRAHGALGQAAYGCQTEALARNAQAGAVGRRFAGLQASRRFETCRIGKSVQMPMAKTTQKITSRVKTQARRSKQAVSCKAC